MSLDNIKIHIYFVQDYFRGEFFVPLKDIKIGGASLSNTLHKYCYLWKDNTLYIKYITIEICLSFLSIREDLYVFTGLLLLSYAHFRWWLLNLSSLVQKCFYFVELLILSFLNLVSSAWFFFCLIFDVHKHACQWHARRMLREDRGGGNGRETFGLSGFEANGYKKAAVFHSRQKAAERLDL